MAKAIIESRTKDGVEIYDVGKQQLWNWAHWAAAGAGNANAWHGIQQTVSVMAESLAKGSYVVMELQFSGRVQDAADILCIQDANMIMRVDAKASTRSLKEAVELAGLYKIKKPMPTCYPSYTSSVNNLIEVWHIVDDAELWQEWEYGVAKSHIAQSMCTDYHLYENRNCVLDCVRELPKVVFSLCTTCEDGTIDSYHYYADFDHFLYDLRFESWLNRNEIENVKTYYAHELGITVVNDDGLDEGLADALPVVVFYLSRQHDE